MNTCTAGPLTKTGRDSCPTQQLVIKPLSCSVGNGKKQTNKTLQTKHPSQENKQKTHKLWSLTMGKFSTGLGGKAQNI